MVAGKKVTVQKVEKKDNNNDDGDNQKKPEAPVKRLI